MAEKTFEERLKSLGTGCIILGILSVISEFTSLNDFFAGHGSLLSVLSGIVNIGLIVGMYYYTKRKDPVGPLLEKIFGYWLLISGILMCISIIGILFGIIYVILSFSIIKEAAAFKTIIDSESATVETVTNDTDKNI